MAAELPECPHTIYPQNRLRVKPQYLPHSHHFGWTRRKDDHEQLQQNHFSVVSYCDVPLWCLPNR